MRHFERMLPLALLFVASAAVARPPQPEPDNLLNDRFGMQAAFIYAGASTTARFDADDGSLGTVIDAEEDLGLPKNDFVGRGEVWFRMRERHRARLATYFIPLERRASTVLTREIAFGNDVFAVNEAVDSRLELDVVAFSYAYSFWKTERVEAALSLGFNSVAARAEARVPARLRTERAERSAVLPLGGLDATFRFAERWYGEARATYLSVTVDDVKGSLLNYEANVLFRVHPNVTAGLGYTGLSIDVDSAQPFDTGLLDFSIAGPQLFLRVGF